MLKLPDTREASVYFYHRVEQDARAQGDEMWRQAERWLGRNDLFYLLVRLLRRVDLNKDWLFDRCREVQAAPDGYLDLWAREHGKAVALDEPILTPYGWRVHGDLRPGDHVYGSDGAPAEVLAVSPIYRDEECYSVEFDDGYFVTVSPQHLWCVERISRKRIGGSREGRARVVMSTHEMAQHSHRDNNRLSVPLAPAFHAPDKELPVDPYVLGCWLGDGSLNAARFVFSNEDAPHFHHEFEKAGHVVRYFSDTARHPTVKHIALDPRDRAAVCIRGHVRTPDNVYRNACRKCRHQQQRKEQFGDPMDPVIADGLSWRLRALGLMNDGNKRNADNDKHIPTAYLQASPRQRLGLLQGLMDTDGYVNPRGTAYFSIKHERLALDTYELCMGLGLKPSWNVRNPAHGAVYHVSFQAYKTDRVFRLSRKLERCKDDEPRRRRFVTSVKPVNGVPTSCIQVSSDDGLYLVGRHLVTTHNSSIITFGATIQDILNDPEITVGLFSHTRPVAKAFLSQIKREFEDNDWLKHIYDDVLWQNPRAEAPRWSEDGGLIVKRKGNPKEATIEAHGLVDGQPTGRHFRLRVYDDVVTRESVTTPEMVNKVTDAWDLSQNLGMTEDQGGKVRYIGTRYSLHDTYAAIIARKAATPRLYAATHNGRVDGMPVLFSDREWAKRVRNSSRAILAAQMLQNPMADTDATFLTPWLRHYEVRPRTLNVYITADPSRGRSADSDNTAIAVIGIASNGAKFLLDGVRHRMTLSQRWFHLRTLYHKWRRQKGVQHIAVGYERYGAQSDDEYFQEQMRIEARRGVEGAHFTIEELNWPRDGTQSKRERVERLEPDFRNSRFFLPLPVWAEVEGKKGPATWRVQDDPDGKDYGAVLYDRSAGLTSAQMRAVQGGSSDLLATAIKGTDQDGHVYDLTVAFIEEYSSFPVGQLKDLIDAASRIYDMEPTAPTVTSKEMTEPAVFWDA